MPAVERDAGAFWRTALWNLKEIMDFVEYVEPFVVCNYAR
jgi:hypothetical protein